MVPALAGFGEFVGMKGLSDVVDGGAEADQIRIEVGFWKFGSDAVDEGAGGVVDEHEVSDETRRSGETLTDARGVRGQRLELAVRQRIRLCHSAERRL